MSRRSLSDYQRNWPSVARLEQRLHRRMDAVIGNSRAVVRQLIGEGIPEAKVRLIYNGIETSHPFQIATRRVAPWGSMTTFS